eukprot:UN24139
MLVYSYPFLHLLVIILSITTIIMTKAHYKYALFTTIFIYFSWVFHTKGKPSMDQAYMNGVLADVNTHHGLNAIVLLMCTPSLFSLSGPICRSLVGSFGQLDKLSRKFYPGLNSKLQIIFSPVVARKDHLKRFGYTMQVYYGIYLVVTMFFGGSGIASIFLY